MKKLLLVLFILLFGAVSAQAGDLETISPELTGDWDFDGGTLQIPNSTTLPSTCDVGDSYQDSNATSGQQFYLCESADTWALQGDGGGGTLSNIVEDTTPELGGELDAGAFSIGFTLQTATGDGTTTINWGLGNKFKFTFGAQNDTFTFTNPANPGNLILILVQDSVGSRTATWPASVKWAGGSAPTLTTTATTGTDIVSFLFDGTNYYAVSSLDFS